MSACDCNRSRAGECACAWTWDGPGLWPPMIDPYIGWANATGRKKLITQEKGKPHTLSVIVKLKPGQTPGSIEKWLTMPPIYFEPLPGTSYEPRFVTGVVEHAALEALCAAVDACEVGLSRLPTGNGAESGSGGAAQRGSYVVAPAARQHDVVIGVIDDGCAFLRDEFADPANHDLTRILALWDQNESGGAPEWQAADRFNYGRVLRQGSIDTLRSQARTAGAAGVYVRLGHVIKTASDTNASTHGTSVLGLAAATVDPTGQQAESAAGIVFVHLPAVATRDTSGGGLPVHVLDGLRFILSTAGADARVVVNISYGGLAGPHDGSSLIEQAIDEILQHRPGTAIVVAAGNGRGSGCQARGVIRAHGSVTLQWDVKPGDATDSFCEVWLRTPDGGTAGDDKRHAVSALLIGPDGFGTMPPPECRKPVAAGEASSLSGTGAPGEVIATVINAPHVPNGKDAMILFALGPVDADGATARTPHGVWCIGLTNDGASDVEYGAYIERDDPVPSASKGGVQSQFIGGPGTGDSLSSLAGGALSIVVGGLRETASAGGLVQTTVADYSGTGPSRGARLGPDALAVCERGEAHNLSSVPFLGQVASSIDRTSAATPVVARWVAQWMKAQTTTPDAQAILDAVRGTSALRLGLPVPRVGGIRRIP